MYTLKKHTTALALLVIAATPLLVFGQSGSTNITSPSNVTGDLTVIGSISKGAGTFVIDHPLDPANKLLYHSFVESPDVKNVYDGNVVLDEKGEATIVLPDYFRALNENPRYLLTPLGEPAPDIYIAARVGKKHFGLFGPIVFEIAGGNPGQKVSWQVTGTRKDPFITDNPIVTEVEKGPGELVDRGEYLFPELYE